MRDSYFKKVHSGDHKDCSSDTHKVLMCLEVFKKLQKPQRLM